MPQILIRDVDAALVARLKERARRHHRSLQGEVKAILEEVAPGQLSPEKARAMIEDWHRRLRGRRLSDSAALIREDRER